jgi:hypothetical protein
MRFFVVITMISLLLMAGCNQDVNSPDIELEDFVSCKSSSGRDYYNNCKGKTIIFSAIVDTYSNDGVRLNLKKSCDDLESVSRVDVVNLNSSFSLNNMERCVKIFAEVGRENFIYPDMIALKVLWIETAAEVSARKSKAESRKAEEERQIKIKMAKETDINSENASFLFEKYELAMITACRPIIEMLSPSYFEWTDSFMDMKFPRSSAKIISPYVFRVTGNKLKIQNGYGAWRGMNYSCDYNAKTGEVVGFDLWGN